MLRITTTHMKEDYLRRNGVSRSSFATLSELLFLHGDYLTWTTIIYDPAYLTEPMIRNASYIRVPHQQMPAYPCPVVVEVVRPKGSVPHHLPGKNPYLTEFAEKAGIPFEVTRGGAETIYPEYQLKGLADRVYAQQFRNAAENAELHIWPVHGNVYVLVGAGGNITLSVGKDGVLVVDSGNVAMSDRVLAAIEQFTRQRDPNGPPLPIRYIINTQVDSDHTGGNAAITASGLFKPLEGGEEIIAHDNVLKRMNETGNQAARAKPTDTYLTGQYKVNRFFNGEGVQVIHMPAAHTDGDSIVWFRFSDVISTGDIFTDS
jgi:glyoxylase-like metal-dependent hydrolase (beta-lactamase superfamily II)